MTVNIVVEHVLGSVAAGWLLTAAALAVYKPQGLTPYGAEAARAGHPQGRLLSGGGYGYAALGKSLWRNRHHSDAGGRCYVARRWPWPARPLLVWR